MQIVKFSTIQLLAYSLKFFPLLFPFYILCSCCYLIKSNYLTVERATKICRAALFCLRKIIFGFGIRKVVKKFCQTVNDFDLIKSLIQCCWKKINMNSNNSSPFQKFRN